MWIMLIKKLPTEVSPPKLSIFWSVLWYTDPDQIQNLKAYIIRRLRRFNDVPYSPSIEKYAADKFFKKYGEKDVFYTPTGKEPNDILSRKIEYKGESIKIFPHEFSILTNERMKTYVENTHKLIANTVAEETVITEILSGELKPIFDAALTDGCNSVQARMTAMGIDVTVPNPEFPAIGWYRCNEKYARYYCFDHEMKE